MWSGPSGWTSLWPSAPLYPAQRTPEATAGTSESQSPAARRACRHRVRFSPMPFGPVAPDLDLPALEQRMLDRWRDDDIVAAARSLREGNEPWTFYEGPPTANGRPG